MLGLKLNHVNKRGHRAISLALGIRTMACVPVKQPWKILANKPNGSPKGRCFNGAEIMNNIYTYFFVIMNAGYAHCTLPHRVLYLSRTGACFANIFCLPAIQILWKFCLAVTPLLPIRSQLILFIRIEGRVKRNFHWIWITIRIALVKQGLVMMLLAYEWLLPPTCGRIITHCFDIEEHPPRLWCCQLCN